MATRCGYYVKDKKLYRKIVDIDWNLGFDREAKHCYCQRLREALGYGVGRVADVTSGSDNPEARLLSPLFVTMTDLAMSVEDWIQKNVLGAIPQEKALVVMHYVYLINLSEDNLRVFAEYDCFTDVFCDPIKKGHNSQAASLGLLKLMLQTDRLDVLGSLEGFCEWLNEVEVYDEREGGVYERKRFQRKVSL